MPGPAEPNLEAGPRADATERRVPEGAGPEGAGPEGAGLEGREPSRRGLVRHGGGFIVSGLIAFSVDAVVLQALTSGAGWHPLGARIVAIALALIAGWLSHRRLTFAVTTPPTLGEFARYAGVAAIAATLNYAIFAGVLIGWPGTPPLLALVAATAVAMGASYAGMRFGVFRAPGWP
ncbi:MAG: GtrA family protein [Hyphomicrobiaceae bacterium]|nr:GtrA family protein [Hyphomicrobiaceae bacterium]